MKKNRSLLRPWVLLFIGCQVVAAAAQVGLPQDTTDAGLGGANAISGMVITAGGRLQRRLSIRLRTMTKGDRQGFTDDYGNFAFRNLPSGDYTIVIDKEQDFQPYQQVVSIIQPRGMPPQTYNLNIRLTAKDPEATKTGVVNSELAGVPEHAVSLYRKAAQLAGTGDHKGAIEQLKLAIAEHPKFTLAYNDLGVQHMKLNDLGNADDAFRTALNIDSKSFAPLQNHGIILFTIRNYPEAEKVFREVVKAKDSSAVGHYFLGQSLAFQDKAKWSEAEKELTTALTLGGEPMAGQMKDAHYVLGLIYGDKGDKKRQITSWETYLKLAPEAPNAEQLREAVAKLKGTE